MDTTLIQFYDHESGQLIKRGEYKVGKLIELNCLKRIDCSTWYCTPIPGYNKRTYTLRLTPDGITCNCQGYNSRIKKGQPPRCAHSTALYRILHAKNI